GEQVVALVVRAEYQQVGLQFVDLGEDHVRRSAIAQAQLGAGRGVAGQAQVQGLLGGVQLGGGLVRRADIEHGQPRVVLASQLSGTAQCKVCRVAQIVGDQNVFHHGGSPPGVVPIRV